MMRKSISILLVMAMFFVMCGCGTNLKTTDTEDSKIEESSEKVSGEVTMPEVHLSVENMRPILIDEKGIKVSISGFGYANDKTVYQIKFLFENGSDKDISVSLTSAVVNGIDVSTSQGKSLVEAGHKSVCDSSVWESEIEEAGITEWTTIEGVVEIREDYYGDVMYKIPVIVDKACWENEEAYLLEHPQKVTESTDEIDAEDDVIILSSDNLYPVILEKDGIKLSINSYGYANSKTVYELKFMLENDTETDISVVLTDVVIDGFDISTSQGKSLVESGHKAVCDSSVWQRDLDEVGISDWSVLKGNIEIRKDYFGDTLYLLPVVIYKNAWESTN